MSSHSHGDDDLLLLHHNHDCAFVVVVSHGDSDDHYSLSSHEEIDDDDDESCKFHECMEGEPIPVVKEVLQSPHSDSKPTNEQLLHLLHENQQALESLLPAPTCMLQGSNHKTHLAGAYDTDIRAIKSSLSSPADAETKVQLSTATSWKDAIQFEIQQSLPGIASLIIYCIAHSSSYELISNLVYEAVEYISIYTTTSNTEITHETSIFAGLLLLGCLLARGTGLIWDFVGTLAYRRVKFQYHNRLRMGAIDARGLHWLHQHVGEAALGFMNVISFYLCYIGVVFFVNRLAVWCDQRESILNQLPSIVYERDLLGTDHPANASTNISSSSSHGDVDFDPMGCSQEQPISFFGDEDYVYLYQRLSKNSYENVFGQEFEAALFDSTHSILYYASLTVFAMYILSAGFHFSFWSGW